MTKPLVIVVEDNDDNMALIEEFLRDDYNILKAFDGDQALTVCRENLPALVLLDISLPRMDGIEVLRELRKLPGYENIPVIAATAHAMAEDRAKFLKDGFDDYIAKPMDEDELNERIRAQIEKRR